MTMESDYCAPSSAAAAKPPGHTHTAHGDAQRQALTEVAFHLIAQGGLERFRTREVAKRAGVNIATLHYYFPSKEDLIRSVVEYLSHEFATRQGPYTGAADEPITEVRRELSDTSYQLAKYPDLFVALFELFMRSLHDPTIREILLAMDARWQQHVITYLADGVRQGALRADLDPVVAAAGLIAFLKGCVMQRMLNPDGFPTERIYTEIERWLVGYAGPGAQTATAR